MSDWITRNARRIGLVVLLGMVVGAHSGCATSAFRRSASSMQHMLPPAGLEQAHQQYLAGLARWRWMDPTCIADFRCSIDGLWPILCAANPSADAYEYAQDLYNAVVRDLIAAANELDCFQPQVGIVYVGYDGQPKVMPVEYHGFTWDRCEYDRFVPVERYTTSMRLKSCTGIGVPLYGFQKGVRPFVDSDAPFAATAVAAPRSSDGVSYLKIVNPLDARLVQRPWETGIFYSATPLTRDTTAPLVYIRKLDPSAWLTGFLRPGNTDKKTGLFMMQPHAPGKIPVVVIHGLISDPVTWVTMVNELLVDPAIQERFEFWAFYYPTGTPFPLEAERLRFQLRQARSYADPDGCDPALDQMVLIGHSMGGLVAKLQITTSGQSIAQSAGVMPMQLAMLPPAAQRALQWSPVHSVRRVIFMATPHHGSEIASRPIGRFASRLVQLNGTSMNTISEVVSNGQYNSSVASTGMQDLPTSIDLLEPENPMLQAIACLPLDCRVACHSIIGVGHGGCLFPPGDGVVPVSSARIAGVESELFVDSNHDVHRRKKSIEEVRRILMEHARCVGPSGLGTDVLGNALGVGSGHGAPLAPR